MLITVDPVDNRAFAARSNRLCYTTQAFARHACSPQMVITLQLDPREHMLRNAVCAAAQWYLDSDTSETIHAGPWPRTCTRGMRSFYKPSFVSVRGSESALTFLLNTAGTMHAFDLRNHGKPLSLVARIAHCVVAGTIGTISLFGTAGVAHAQMAHGDAMRAARPEPMADAGDGRMKGMAASDMMTGPLGIPMTRDGSGTSWQPDSSPMAAIHANIGEWQFMLHGVAFLGLDSQGSARGDTQFNSVNWLMGMASHPLGAGVISARVMMSLEPLTVGGFGYPLLLQTGESWRGQPLHDRQHPHDLFMETALMYTTPITDDIGAQFYAAPAGEPAFGPVAFPHRVSARSNPLAPIGHHWQDSTHISYGVVTAGVFGRLWKVEGSWFDGREPDENRYNFDLRTPDSFSARLSVNPSSNLSLQASYGYLKSPEGSEPDVSLKRLSASGTLNRHVFDEGNWATTAAWGTNIQPGRATTSMGLVESNLDATMHHTLFGRVEAGQKTGADLILLPAQASQRFGMAAFSLGYAFRFSAFAHIVPSLGAVGTLNVVGSELGRAYETRTPVGGMVFLQIRPEDMAMRPGPGQTMPGMQMH